MSSDPARVLKHYFGYDQFRPGQREVVEHLLEGRSAAAVFPTGGGKSLCYQLPALMLDGGVTLVVSPLIALMKDQIDALARRGIAAQRLDSSLGPAKYRQVMQQVRAGELRLLYVAPERFNNERFREAIRHIRVALFAVDEAHCISEWGHNFRPDYLKLAGFARACAAQRVLALTATATPKVLEDIRRVFEIDADCAVRTGFYRPNLTLLMTKVNEHERDATLLAKLRERPRGPTIVYVTLQRTAEQVAEMLVGAGFDARAYHAGMDPPQRTVVQEWFLKSDEGVVAATIAFGMGIDKADIRYVYHYNLPKSLENFSQEIGRAGRDAQPSICHTLACEDDRSTLENFIYGDTPQLHNVRDFVREIFSLGEGDGAKEQPEGAGEFDVSVFDLARAHHIKPLVVRTLLTYLELLDHIEGGTPFYAHYRFKPIMSSRQILQRFGGERRTFLANLFRQARPAQKWLHLDAEAAAARLGVRRQRVVAALDYLSQQRMLELKTAGVRLRYRLLKSPPDRADLAKKLHQRTVEREKSEIGRLDQVLDLVRREGCQVAALAGHFGERRDQPCGHCTWCLRTGSGAAGAAQNQVVQHPAAG